jgi:DNA-binding NarL/FixJ family response regulator
MKRIQLLLVDDHVLFRQSLSRLLVSEPDFEVVADCGATNDAIEILRLRSVDVVLLDFDLGQDYGNRFITAARQTGRTPKILMVTAGMTATESAAALQLGASGIFLKHASPAELADAIRAVASGTIWMHESIIQKMAARVETDTGQQGKPSLTEREQQVLQGVFEGLANKEIGVRLNVSESAIKSTLQQLFRKTHVRTRSQLVRIALEGAYTWARKT